MDKQKKQPLLLLSLFVPLGILRMQCVDASSNGVNKLFVFGDSYADSGNLNKSTYSSWKPPYGITYPGYPSGRFSNGRILVDYIATYYGIPSPVAYEERESGTTEYGVNFAFGGAGVFKTLFPVPNITGQIDLLQQLIDDKQTPYSQTDLLTSLAVVFVSGDDYIYYAVSHAGSLQGLAAYANSVINQLVLDLKRIHDLGVPNVLVSGLGPLGCLPPATADSSYTSCNSQVNGFPLFHNQLLFKSLEKLNFQSMEPVFFLLDLYDAFLAAIQGHVHLPDGGILEFENRLKPCCQGVDAFNFCGDTVGGQPMYTVCPDPQSYFFWDVFHPTQQGWYGAYLVIQPFLPQFTET
ncbi:hypothetical protein Nepgr_012066 [Nepenthes gracilis]|uniref:GDSL esterase/lipase n=1 Tax=Nepenthes gracilis TaxID=150966 RepID=A0AAD3SG94_NEPGR|nr:hypothetical protein Nepgr_012066 [Nepenthes gracilis]